MKNRTAWLLPGVLVLAVTGCNLFTWGDQPPADVQRITTFDQVSGEWEGKVDKLLPSGQDSGPLVLDIKGDGMYKFLTGLSTDPGLGDLPPLNQASVGVRLAGQRRGSYGTETVYRGRDHRASADTRD